MIRVNLQRTDICSVCERQTPVRNRPNHVKEVGERDVAELCARCERGIRAGIGAPVLVSSHEVMR